MATMYAWSNFPTEFDEWGRPTKTIEPGETVTQNKLGISDAEWEELIAVNAVSELPYPDIPGDVSPNEHYRQQEAALLRGELTAELAKEVMKRVQAQGVDPDVGSGLPEGVEEATEPPQGDNYDNMNFKELMDEAKTREIEGRSNMDSDQLREALRNYDASNPQE